jgi:hypothetical protein
MPLLLEKSIECFDEQKEPRRVLLDLNLGYQFSHFLAFIGSHEDTLESQSFQEIPVGLSKRYFADSPSVVRAAPEIGRESRAPFGALPCSLSLTARIWGTRLATTQGLGSSLYSSCVPVGAAADSVAEADRGAFLVQAREATLPITDRFVPRSRCCSVP